MFPFCLIRVRPNDTLGEWHIPEKWWTLISYQFKFQNINFSIPATARLSLFPIQWRSAGLHNHLQLWDLEILILGQFVHRTLKYALWHFLPIRAHSGWIFFCWCLVVCRVSTRGQRLPWGAGVWTYGTANPSLMAWPVGHGHGNPLFHLIN